MEEQSGESKRRRWSPWQLFGLYTAAIIVWLFLSIPPHEGEDTATYAGRYTGAATAFLLFGLLVWLIIWLVDKVAVRYCQEMEIRGFLDDKFSQAKVNKVMAEIVGEMQARGELPDRAPVG